MCALWAVMHAQVFPPTSDLPTITLLFLAPQLEPKLQQTKSKPSLKPRPGPNGMITKGGS